MNYRCSACPSMNACLAHDGPVTARVLLIGEAPGKDENKKGRIFIGKTGQEVDQQYLPLASLRRDDVCMVNAIGCLPTTAGGKLDPTRAKDIELLTICASERLLPFIESQTFEVLVPMGRFATMAVCGPNVDLEMQHGIPCPSVLGIPAFPMYHPALGIHEPKKMVHLRYDWDRLKRFLRGKLQLPTDHYVHVDYQEVTDANEIDGLSLTDPLGMDTESIRGGSPYCFTYSSSPGMGRLVRASRPDLCRRFQHHLSKRTGRIIFHNWLYDSAVMEQMGIHIPHPLLVDTMAEAYHIGILPQGLKTAAYRELGMQMQDFDDVVAPHSKLLVLDYYRRMQEVTWPKPAEEVKWDDKTQLYKLYKPQTMNTKLKRFFTDYGKNRDKDVFNMMEENWAEHQPMIEETMGEPYPGKCISHVPFEQALYYACRDADATRRYYLDVIQPMQRMVRRASSERWRDAVAV